jgi:hypothetical protein
LNYYTYEKEFGNTIVQGVETKLYIGEVIASYMFWHNLFIDFQLTYRKTASALGQFNSQTFNPSVAFRWNINYQNCDY